MIKVAWQAKTCPYAPSTYAKFTRLSSGLQALAGALQDSSRATIAGEGTFGKGLIQTIVDLSDVLAVSVTVLRYQMPAGIDNDQTGIAWLQVLAGALQDNGRATIAGEGTFGKGLIQTIVELSDGSAVSVTVSRYQTPAGTDINKVGIKPDILLEDQTILPSDAENFCKVIATPLAPKLFK